ncbi:small nuclear ribonucleoprotein, partial [Magnaporthiopsis poae ATCC 64411]
MDAPEEDADIKLQKISSDLIADFDRSLQPFLHRADGTVRGQVRSHEATRLATSLLDPFQELPQLLDPHLSRWVPALGDALVDYLAAPRRSRTRSIRAGLLMPLPAAICKLLYTLCKIRGEKVVVRFLSVETRHLERLMSALEDSERSA